MSDKIEVCESGYDIHKKEWIPPRIDQAWTPTANAKKPELTLRLTCPGAFLHADPDHLWHEQNGKWSKSDGKKQADLIPLQRADNDAVLSGKSVMQHLRSRSAWIECLRHLEKNGYDYDDPKMPVDNPDRLLSRNEGAETLTITQRLFGAGGWAKTLRVTRAKVIRQSDFMSVQGIKLDRFTQGPIDGALLDLRVANNLDAEVWLNFRQDRYKDGLERYLDRDIRHLRALLDELGARDAVMRLGHGSARGMGWFDLEEIQFVPKNENGG